MSFQSFEMTPCRMRELVRLSNNLSNRDLMTLLEMRSDDINIFVGCYKMRCITRDVESITMNGTVIQVNCKDCQDDEKLQKEIEEVDALRSASARFIDEERK